MIDIPHKDYFEGVLQLRDLTNELLDWVYKRVKKDQRAVITKEKKVRGGVDLYLSSQRYLQSLGKKLNETFPGILKITATLHTKAKTGEDLYRVTVLFKLLPFRIRQVFDFEGEKVEILHMGKKVRIKYLKSGEKKHVDIARIIRAVK